MGSRMSAPSIPNPPQTNSEATYARDPQATPTRSSNEISDTNSNLSNQHRNNSVSPLASHPSATTTILMRAHNQTPGFASMLTSELDQPTRSPYHYNIFASRGYQTQFRCPVCLSTMLTEEIEHHLNICLTKTSRISYNEDILTCNKGECVICLDDLVEGDRIARLPCLCIYHKTCIDRWFEVNRSCPEHPSD